MNTLDDDAFQPAGPFKSMDEVRAYARELRIAQGEITPEHTMANTATIASQLTL